LEQKFDLKTHQSHTKNYWYCFTAWCTFQS